MAIPQEKLHLDGSDNEKDSSSDQTTMGFDEKHLRKIRRRIDLRLIPALGLMYGISLMDRKNVSNAAIAGMLDDLDLNKGYGYNIITLSFFITYVLVQPVMTILCRKFGPRLFLSFICVAWGAVIIGFGFVKHWSVQVPLRLLLGAFEAGFFPGAVYLLSTWYTRFEIGRRYSVFYLIGGLLAALSGILAYGLGKMEGKSGIRGWRWIFIMEGVFTCAVGLFAYTVLVKFPDEEYEKPSKKFLTIDETKVVLQRLNADRQDVELEPFSLKAFLKPALDLEVWVFAFLFFLSTTISYSFAFFMPIVLKQNLKFSLAASQCLGSPPYALAALTMYYGGWAGDRYKKRAMIIYGNSVLSLIGIPIMAFHPKPAVKYFGIFIAVAGVNANIPAIMAYQANNVRGQWKRAFSSALLTTFGGIGGIAGSLVFRTQDKPGYFPGMLACVVCAILTVVVTALLSLYFVHRNRKADRGEVILNESPDFRYVL